MYQNQSKVKLAAEATIREGTSGLVEQTTSDIFTAGSCADTNGIMDFSFWIFETVIAKMIHRGELASNAFTNDLLAAIQCLFTGAN